jgi:diguanylate cyclase (GGDEF)-like protein/PAS domain S-box-containing protein
MPNEIRVLVLEDEPADAELEIYQLERAGLRCVSERVDTADEFRRALEEFRPDVVLSDFTLPSFNGITALGIAQERLPQAPFLFVSGTIGEERAIEALRRGATDYVLKTNLARLAPAVKRALQEARERNARAEAERQLRLSEDRFRTLASHAPAGIFLTDLRGDCLYVNDCWLDMTRATRERSLGRGWLTALHPDDREYVVRDWQSTIGAGAPFNADFRLVTPAGEVLWVIGRSAPVRDDSGAVATCIWTVADVTELRLQQRKIARQNRVHAVLSGINGAIVRTRNRTQLFDEACGIAVREGKFRLARIHVRDADTDHIVLATERSDEHDAHLFMAEATDDASLVESAFRTAQPAVCNDVASDPRMARSREQLIAGGQRALAVLPLVVENRAYGCLSLYAGEPAFFDEEEMRLLAELGGDISFALEHIEKAEQLDYLAYFDPVTGLPNRTQFQQRLTQAIGAARETGAGLAVVFADIERFKNINNTLGRQAGDTVLRTTAKRLQAAMRDVQNVARVQADCFAGLVVGFEREERLARDLHQRLAQALAEPLVIAGEELHLAMRSGIAFYPADGIDADNLLRNAEAALKQAKTLAESFVVYTPDINARIAEQLSLENRLRRAVEQQRFTLQYQPKIDLATGRLSGAEALIRWTDDELGAVPPEKFIPLLEETGLILEVGKWALRHAAEVSADWAGKGLPPIRIAVNVSPLQLREKDFVAAVERAIARSATRGAPGIDLEITESVIMHNIEENIAKLNAVRELGLEIAIDDFGTGYSSLAYIAKLPVSVIKIDRSFISRMATDADGMTIVSSMINLGHSLKLKIVAEGVETAAQVRLLARLGCDEYQGYVFSPPVTAAHIETLLREPAAALPR